MNPVPQPPRGGMQQGSASRREPKAGKAGRGALSAHRQHALGLMQPTAPYTYLRHTVIFSTNANVLLFGTYATETSSGTAWTPVVCLSDVNSGNPINGTLNTTLHKFANFNGLGTGAEVVPAAFSVRVINPNALQVTSGTLTASRLQGGGSYGNSTSTWIDAATTSFGNCAPMIISGSQLAMSPKQCHALPADFTEMARFDRVLSSTDAGLPSPFTWNSTALHPAGFAPILVRNDITPSGSTTYSNLTYEVTVKWRVRVSPENPFSSTHVYQPVSSASTWQDAVATASSVANGFETVLAIAERIRGPPP